jgi:hypothetical protein
MKAVNCRNNVLAKPGVKYIFGAKEFRAFIKKLK